MWWKKMKFSIHLKIPFDLWLRAVNARVAKNNIRLQRIHFSTGIKIFGLKFEQHHEKVSMKNKKNIFWKVMIQKSVEEEG